MLPTTTKHFHRADVCAFGPKPARSSNYYEILNILDERGEAISVMKREDLLKEI